MSRVSRTRSYIQETLEETVRIKIICAVKGYQECRFRVDLVESILKKMGSKGRSV